MNYAIINYDQTFRSHNHIRSTRKVVVTSSLKRLGRWLRVAAWLHFCLSGTAWWVIVVAVATANSPQSQPPFCFWESISLLLGPTCSTSGSSSLIIWLAGSSLSSLNLLAVVGLFLSSLLDAGLDERVYVPHKLVALCKVFRVTFKR